MAALLVSAQTFSSLAEQLHAKGLSDSAVDVARKLEVRHVNLIGPNNDADLLYNALVKTNVHVTKLQAHNAGRRSKEMIESGIALRTVDSEKAFFPALARATSRLCEGSTLIMLLTGHGGVDEETGEWAFPFENARLWRIDGSKEIKKRMPLFRSVDDESVLHASDLRAILTFLTARKVNVLLVVDASDFDPAEVLPVAYRCCDEQAPDANDGVAVVVGAAKNAFSTRAEGNMYGLLSYQMAKLLSKGSAQSVRTAAKELVQAHWLADACQSSSATRLDCLPRIYASAPDGPLLPARSTGSRESGVRFEWRGSSGESRGEQIIVEAGRIEGRIQPTEGLVGLDIANKRVEPIAADGSFALDLPLARGDNELPVVALYRDRPAGVTTLRVHSNSGRWQLNKPKRQFALLIGNWDYEPGRNGFKRLQTPEADVDALAAVLRDRYGFLLEVPRAGAAPHPLLLKNADRAQIYASFRALATQVGPDDAVLVYYAGHGNRLETRGYDGRSGKPVSYWVPAGARREAREADWISADDITGLVASLGARHVLLISDSCFAGGLLRGESAVDVDTSNPERVLAELSGKASRMLMASGGDEPVLDGGGSGHSVFARALLEALKSPPSNTFSAAQIFQTIQRTVGNAATQIPEFSKLPGRGGTEHAGGQMIFVGR